MKSLTSLFIFLSFFSTLLADNFQQNTALVNTLKANNVRVIVLCNFQGTNNVLDIVTASRSPGYELTNLGLAMLQDAIPVLSAQNITQIYTAQAFRALQTTNQLGKAFGLPPARLVPDARLSMQNFGSDEGLNYTLYRQEFTSESDMLENTQPTGESGLAVFNRSQDFLTSLETLQNQTVLVVTHAFNCCHMSKILTGKFGNVPSPGTYVVYDFNATH
jgi:broad specificity phosphatase PhoE